MRVEVGGHDVPEEKIRGHLQRLWQLVRTAICLVSEAQILDNSRAKTPFRPVARYRGGQRIGAVGWPPWTPSDLRR